MKRYIDCLCLCVLLAVCCVACREEEDASLSRTGFLISLVEAPQVGVEARTTPVEIGKPLVEKFKLKIVKQPSTPFYDDIFKKEIDASQGTYTLTAYYGDNSLGLDKPYYKGTAEATVSEGLTSVKIEARVANALVSVKYEDEALFESIYIGGYHVDVEVGNQRISLDDITKSVYFPAGSTVKLYFMGKKAGDVNYQSYELKSADLPSSFAAGDHAIITLSAQNMGVSIKKAEVTQVEISETIPLEWLPNPKVAVQGFDENHSLTYYETETPEAGLQFTTALGLEELKFKVDFQDATYSSLNGEYALSTMTLEEKQKFAEAGITLPEIGNTEKNVMDFEAFITKLTGSNDQPTIYNVITLKEVKANGKSILVDVPQSYTIAVKKAPVFSISVDDWNVWAKEFTINDVVVTEGDADAVREGIVYQYKYAADGDDKWIDCNNGKLQVFDVNPTQRELNVRAKFRDFVYTLKDEIVLEEMKQIPNSDMESWYVKDLGKPSILLSGNYYDFLPYVEGEDDIWWATNNQRSQDYNSTGAADVTTSPCVSYTESVVYSGQKAALIYTSGHGGGYPSTSAICYSQSAFAGSLFIGSYNCSSEKTGGFLSVDRTVTEDITTGHLFPSRPKRFQFYYQYAPKGSDSFKAYIELRNEETVIACGEFISDASTSWKQAGVELVYTDCTKKATSIYVQFLSSTKTSFSKSDFDIGKSITFPVMGEWKAHIGSMLYIDELHLEY